jgi:hypothetical protein
MQFVVPYKLGHFIMYQQRLRLTPQTVTLPHDDRMVRIVGLFVEIINCQRPKKQIINGPRGTWHGKIKFFIKSSMEE